jgi:chemotaxis protein MotB
MADKNNNIIIKKVKKAGHGHHGGAWKIAYADFVTAMMAFFLLMWLINMTTPEQKQGLADYFAPPNVSISTSGAGGVMGGKAMGQDGAQSAGTASSDRGGTAHINDNDPYGAKKEAGSGDNDSEGGLKQANQPSQADIQSQYEQIFHSAAASIRQAWQNMPEITDLEDNLMVQQTKDGLEIILMNQQGRRMFAEGSKQPLDYTRKAIAAVAPVLQQLPVQLRISGHTAAGITYKDPAYGEWELSADRANVVRSILEEYSLTDNRVNSVVGRGTSEPFFPDNPYMAANERVKITLMNNVPPVMPNVKP